MWAVWITKLCRAVVRLHKKVYIGIVFLAACFIVMPHVVDLRTTGHGSFGYNGCQGATWRPVFLQVSAGNSNHTSSVSLLYTMMFLPPHPMVQQRRYVLALPVPASVPFHRHFFRFA